MSEDGRTGKGGEGLGSNLPALFSHPLPNDSDLTALVAELPPSEVAGFAVAAEEVRRCAAKAKALANQRIVAERILEPGEVVGGFDGQERYWGGDRERVVSDPYALREAMRPLVMGDLAQRYFAEAFIDQPPKVYLSKLDEVVRWTHGDRIELKRIIRSFVPWVETNQRLRVIKP